MYESDEDSSPHSWRYKAACKDEDTNTFYPPRHRSEYKRTADRAKSFCFGGKNSTPCPVRSECLWFAVDTHEPHGIWGGLSHRERNALVRRWNRTMRTLLTLKEFIMRGNV